MGETADGWEGIVVRSTHFLWRFMIMFIRVLWFARITPLCRHAFTRLPAFANCREPIRVKGKFGKFYDTFDGILAGANFGHAIVSPFPHRDKLINIPRC